jgi:soluble lytic murein transglycosylase-like protein
MHRCVIQLGLAAVLAAGLPAWAGSTVVFSDGRSMRVEDVERHGDTALLRLEGGGALAVPAERVANWPELSRGSDRSAPKEPVRSESPSLPSADWRRMAGEYAELIARTAEQHELDPALLTAVAQVESAFDPLAVSPKGARGLLQLMPETAERFGVEDPFDAADNVEGGARYLRWLLERYDGRTDLALAGYNAGEGAVDRHSGVPPYRETRRYVRRVLSSAASLGDRTR